MMVERNNDYGDMVMDRRNRNNAAREEYGG
jgi:hypothetical protein